VSETPTSTPAITAADVAHLARLARIEIPAEELAHYASQLEVILGSVAKVGEVASADVPATSHPMPLVNVFREDIPVASLGQDNALAAAPSVEDGRFRVPRIMDEE
jgi:aspartyl-tRNA(Asn)/glutamyl-tRNA(Gln) amidotransferase subunit C